MPEAPAVYDGDTITDRSERFLAAEILRESIPLYWRGVALHQHGSDRSVCKMDGKMRRIAATILVDRDSHKAMIIGQKGERLKRFLLMPVSTWKSSLMEKVFLETRVKVKRGC